jgi:hypothetical protein
LFEEFRIEGNEGSSDNIYLELLPDNLVKAMKSAGAAQVVKIKLTQKMTPCLTFEIILVCSFCCFFLSAFALYLLSLMPGLFTHDPAILADIVRCLTD